MKEFVSFVIKEAKHIVRDKRTMLILFGMPVVLMLLFGYAITNDVRNVRLVVVTSSADHQTQRAIDRLAAASKDAKMVALGDKLSNMRAIWRDWMEKGDDIWNIFHVTDRAEHEWHYRGLADSLRELDDTVAFKEFEHLINKVFGKK